MQIVASDKEFNFHIEKVWEKFWDAYKGQNVDKEMVYEEVMLCLSLENLSPQQVARIYDTFFFILTRFCEFDRLYAEVNSLTDAVKKTGVHWPYIASFSLAKGDEIRFWDAYESCPDFCSDSHGHWLRGLKMVMPRSQWSQIHAGAKSSWECHDHGPGEKMKTDRNLILLSCSSEYFKKFMPGFISNLIKIGWNEGVHVCLINPDEETLGLALRYSEMEFFEFTYDEERCGYHCDAWYSTKRFVDAHHIMCERKANLWILDIDLVMHKDPRSLFTEKLWQHGLLGFRFNTRPYFPWMKISGNFCYIPFNKEGSYFLYILKEYVGHFGVFVEDNHEVKFDARILERILPSHLWFVEQTALLYAYLAQFGLGVEHGFNRLEWEYEKSLVRFTGFQKRVGRKEYFIGAI